jgi:signal transduction histidine kinase
VLGAAALAVLFWWNASRCRAYAARGVAQERRAQRAVQRAFLRRLTHELNNIATVLHVSMIGLSDVADSESPRPLALVGARQRLEHLAALSKALGQLARAGAAPERRELVSLAAVVDEALDLARQAPGRDMALGDVAVRVADGRANVMGDADLLVHAVYQLLDNAFKFGGGRGPISVSVGADGAWATVAVADAGPGIAPEHLPRVAEPLYRVAGTHTEGLGMGLTLAAWIAEAHDGQLVVDSRPRGGTVATLRLPLGPTDQPLARRLVSSLVACLRRVLPGR